MDQRINKLDQMLAEDLSLDRVVFDQLRAAQRELGLVYGDRPTCPFLRPYILNRRQYDDVKHAAETVARAFEKVADKALIEKKLMSLLCPTPLEEEMARMDPGYARLCVTSRLDSYITAHGFHFLEYNAENPAGIGDQMQLENLLFTLPPLQSFLARHRHWLPQPHRLLLESLLQAYRKWGGEVERPHIAIVDWHGVPTGSEFRVLRDYFAACGYPAVIADPHDLHYNGDTLSVGGFRIDIVYKRVVIHEFLTKFPREHPLTNAYKDGRVFMANSFRSKLVHKKAGFAVLSDESYNYLFSPEEREVIRRHIPWTRFVSESKTVFCGAEWDLRSLIRAHRREFVLKPNDDYGGRGIFAGWESSAEEWDAALRTALDRPYVVQERVAAEKISMPAYSDHVSLEEMYVDFNPFLFHNKVEGALIRLSSSAMMNVTSGGGQTALLVLEE